MSLATAFTGTVAGDFLLVTLVLVALKLLSGLVQARLMRGNYRDMPDTTLFRLIYIIGKVTPALASFCAFVSAYLLHDRFHSWFFGCFTICAAKRLKRGPPQLIEACAEPFNRRSITLLRYLHIQHVPPPASRPQRTRLPARSLSRTDPGRGGVSIRRGLPRKSLKPRRSHKKRRRSRRQLRSRAQKCPPIHPFSFYKRLHSQYFFPLLHQQYRRRPIIQVYHSPFPTKIPPCNLNQPGVSSKPECRIASRPCDLPTAIGAQRRPGSVLACFSENSASTFRVFEPTEPRPPRSRLLFAIN